VQGKGTWRGASTHSGAYIHEKKKRKKKMAVGGGGTGEISLSEVP